MATTPTYEQLLKIQLAYRFMSVAQSFLDGIKDLPTANRVQDDAFVNALVQGNASADMLASREQAWSDAHPGDPMPDYLSHGNSALTLAQANEIARDYQLLDYQSNTGASGFSGALLKNKLTGEITWVVRDTEFTPQAFGGNASQDLQGADKGQLVPFGMAYGQVVDANAMLDRAISGGLIPPDAKISVVAGSLSGNIFLTVQQQRPELFNDAPEANVLINPTGLGVPRFTQGFFTPGPLQGPALYTEITRLYSAIQADPSLVENQIRTGFQDNPDLNSLLNQALAAPVLGPNDNIYDNPRSRLAAMFTSKWFGMDLPGPNLLGADNPKTIDNPSVLSTVQQAFAGPDGFYVSTLGYQPSDRVYVPIESQPFLELGG